MSYEDLGNREMPNELFDLVVDYYAENNHEKWALIQKSKYGEPDLVEINYESSNGICITEHGFGEWTSTIDYSKILMVGGRKELQIILNNYLKIRELSQAAKDTME